MDLMWRRNWHHRCQRARLMNRVRGAVHFALLLGLCCRPGLHGDVSGPGHGPKVPTGHSGEPRWSSWPARPRSDWLAGSDGMSPA
jgi:hypothetical protein